VPARVAFLPLEGRLVTVGCNRDSDTNRCFNQDGDGAVILVIEVEFQNFTDTVASASNFTAEIVGDNHNLTLQADPLANGFENPTIQIPSGGNVAARELRFLDNAGSSWLPLMKEIASANLREIDIVISSSVNDKIGSRTLSEECIINIDARLMRHAKSVLSTRPDGAHDEEFSKACSR
jgi:hypothetical protein